jgi:hypothetical protein
MRNPKKHPVPISGVVYGEIIYWLTVGSSFVVLLGTIISFIETQSLVSSTYILQSVFGGKNVEEIWIGSDIGHVPDIIFYLTTFSFGESITILGIAFGVFSVIPAVFCASYFLWRSRNPVFAVSAVFAGVITICSMLAGVLWV